MLRYAACLLVVMTAVLAGAGAVAADQDTFYYQGYFEAQATAMPMGAWVYRAETDTFQSTFYSRYRTVPLPRYEREQPPCGISNIQPGTVTLYSQSALPGAYWYDDPDRFQVAPSCNLGYLYGRTR